MSTRDERRKETLMRRKNYLEGKMLPMHREIARIDGELELIHQYEKAERDAAQETLGLNDSDEEAA